MSDAAALPLILIVEDDDVTRMDAAVMIREAGFNVLEAANGDEAMAFLESSLPIVVVFTDIEMDAWLDRWTASGARCA